MRYIMLLVLTLFIGCSVNYIPNKYNQGDVLRLKVSDKKFIVTDYNYIDGYYRLAYFDENGSLKKIIAFDYAIEGQWEDVDK